MMRAAALTLLFTLVVSPLAGAAPLFPTPLHLTRQLHEPISGKTIVLNEYGYGNRLVTVRGPRTSIADYEKGELIEIDREAGTYSVTRFEAVAKAAQAFGTVPLKPLTPRRAVRPTGAKSTSGGRAAEFFEGEIDNDAGRQTVEVGVDRSVLLSRAALEVLLGAAYPGVRSAEHDVVFSAAAPVGLRAGSDATDAPADQRSYALPVEHVIRYEVEGERLEFRSAVTRVGSEPPPTELVSIPPDARLVESRIVAVNRELEQLDNPGAVPPNP